MSPRATAAGCALFAHNSQLLPSSPCKQHLLFVALLRWWILLLATKEEIYPLPQPRLLSCPLVGLQDGQPRAVERLLLALQWYMMTVLGSPRLLSCPLLQVAGLQDGQAPYLSAMYLRAGGHQAPRRSTRRVRRW